MHLSYCTSLVSTASVESPYESSCSGATDNESSKTDSSTSGRIPTERRSRRRRRKKPSSRIEWSSVSSADSSRPPNYFANSAALTFQHNRFDDSFKIASDKSTVFSAPQEDDFFVTCHKNFKYPVSQTPPPLSTNKSKRKENSYWKNKEIEEIDLPLSSCNEHSLHKYSTASTATYDPNNIYKKALAELDQNAKFNNLVKKYGLEACVSGENHLQQQQNSSPVDNSRYLDSSYECLPYYYPFNNLRRAPTPFRVVTIESEFPSTDRMEAQNGTRPEGSNGHYGGDAVRGVCTIPARKSGVFALGFQAVAFILCASIVTVFFCHIGGYSTIANGVFHIGVNRTHVNKEGDIIGYSQAYAVADWNVRAKRQADENEGNGNKNNKKNNKKNGKNKNRKSEEIDEDEDNEEVNQEENQQNQPTRNDESFPTPILMDPQENKNADDEIDLPQTPDEDIMVNVPTSTVAIPTMTTIAPPASIRPSIPMASEAAPVPEPTEKFPEAAPIPTEGPTQISAEDDNSTMEAIVAPDDEMLPIDMNTTVASVAVIATTEIVEDEEELLAPFERIYDGPFPLVNAVTLHIGRMEIELLNILRASCVVYLVICFIWFLSLICLGMSLYFEVLDLVYTNIFVLTVVSIYTLIKALLIGILIFKQKTIDWHILGVISGTVGVLILSFILMVGAMVLMIVWYRYIDYMNGANETCVCTSSIAQLIKRRHGSARQPRRQNVAGDYSIPEATQHASLPYIDEPPVHQFSNF
ncbi:unnamed protein product [Bursaphelenchus okinawaensis]|uniref:Uncharacterized protein n=1 Tax=Bursaphelenchus okinawaensis TaxID=465554 RepID=A0A811KFB7_9BILA|nr:unnamed protein product [Bursaphelenchus okinawaensis]CAG9101051.1 unnamed protein product [Bursaphelenchus okinawaensis]